MTHWEIPFLAIYHLSPEPNRWMGGTNCDPGNMAEEKLKFGEANLSKQTPRPEVVQILIERVR